MQKKMQMTHRGEPVFILPGAACLLYSILCQDRY